MEFVDNGFYQSFLKRIKENVPAAHGPFAQSADNEVKLISVVVSTLYCTHIRTDSTNINTDTRKHVRDEEAILLASYHRNRRPLVDYNRQFLRIHLVRMFVEIALFISDQILRSRQRTLSAILSHFIYALVVKIDFEVVAKRSAKSKS